MFSVEQKRSIADKVQQILKDTGHPELPVTEIIFMLHVEGRMNWSWADIKNNGAVLSPSVNPWNEVQDKGTPKPLAQYLAEYLATGIDKMHEVGLPMDYTKEGLKPIFEQVLEAYQSTENVTIKIERNV